MKKAPKKIKKLSIIRSKWLRGETHSRLLREDGKMCCLGFLARACGATEGQIREKSTPSETTRVRWPAGMVNKEVGDTCSTVMLMEVNDAIHKDHKKRERSIKRLFKRKFNIEVKFVGRTKVSAQSVKSRRPQNRKNVRRVRAAAG